MEGGRETERQRLRETERDIERHRETERDRERQRETERDRERQRETERDRERQLSLCMSNSSVPCLEYCLLFLFCLTVWYVSEST